MPEHFTAACQAADALTLRMRDGYDHSYHFIASFIGEHIALHRQGIGLIHLTLRHVVQLKLRSTISGSGMFLKGILNSPAVTPGRQAQFQVGVEQQLARHGRRALFAFQFLDVDAGGRPVGG